MFSLSFYLKGADPYLIVGFQRKNESCQKCCQFFFYEAWQRTFYFLHILWDLEIDLGISPLKVHIIIPTCISKILFCFQRALAYMIQLCQSWQAGNWNPNCVTHYWIVLLTTVHWVLWVIPRKHLWPFFKSQGPSSTSRLIKLWAACFNEGHRKSLHKKNVCVVLH